MTDDAIDFYVSSLLFHFAAPLMKEGMLFHKLLWSHFVDCAAQMHNAGKPAPLNKEMLLSGIGWLEWHTAVCKEMPAEMPAEMP